MQDNLSKIEISHGYSKDHRPDLKQIVLSLIVNGPSEIPLWMETLSGNSSDKKSFHETIEKVREFQEEIKLDEEFKYVADSALYSSKYLLKESSYLWLSRVPETIKEAKELVECPSEKITWDERIYKKFKSTFLKKSEDFSSSSVPTKLVCHSILSIQKFLTSIF